MTAVGLQIHLSAGVTKNPTTGQLACVNKYFVASLDACIEIITPNNSSRVEPLNAGTTAQLKVNYG